MKTTIKENITKSEVTGEVKKYIDSAEFKAKIEKIVKDRIKEDKMLEDKVVEITKNVLSQLYKTLWVKKSVWLNNISNKKN